MQTKEVDYHIAKKLSRTFSADYKEHSKNTTLKNRTEMRTGSPGFYCRLKVLFLCCFSVFQ